MTGSSLKSSGTSENTEKMHEHVVEWDVAGIQERGSVHFQNSRRHHLEFILKK